MNINPYQGVKGLVATTVEHVLKNVEQINAIAKEQSQSNQNIAQMLDSLRDVGQRLVDMVGKNNN